MLNGFFKKLTQFYNSFLMENENLMPPSDHEATSDHEAPEVYGVTEKEHTIVIDQEANMVKTVLSHQLEKAEPTVGTKKIARSDPYAGYLAPNGRNKRQRKKKILEQEPVVTANLQPVASSVEYNGVVVSYTQDTIPVGMEK